MGEVQRTIFYLFVLALFLIAVAYWGGTNKILGTLFGGVNTIDLTATGRDKNGQFAAYATGGPA